MAKSKEEINKAHAIREALRANRDKSPSEIADLLKAKGVDVNGQYVEKDFPTSPSKSACRFCAIKNIRLCPDAVF